MKRCGLCAGLGAGFLVLSGAAAPVVAQSIDSDVFGRDTPPSTIIVGPPAARTERPDPAPASAAQAQRGNPLWEIPIKTLAATRDRPIFSPSRRPPPVAVAAPYVPPRSQAKPASPQLTLLGTVLSAADEERAGPAGGIGVFLDQTNNTVVRLKTGDDHNGWILRSVQGREATLQSDREAVVLALPARGTERAGISSANTRTNISAVQPVRELQERVGSKFQLEKYD